MRYLHCKPAAFMLLGAMFIGGGCDQGADAPKADSGHSEENVFRDASLETGLIFHHVNGAAGEFYLPEIMGAGAALIDFDDDGDLDVFLVQGTSLDGVKRGEEVASRLPTGDQPRRWTAVEKARIVSESFWPGKQVGEVTRCNHITVFVNCIDLRVSPQ